MFAEKPYLLKCLQIFKSQIRVFCCAGEIWDWISAFAEQPERNQNICISAGMLDYDSIADTPYIKSFLTI